jgi:hypothetical protein
VAQHMRVNREGQFGAGADRLQTFVLLDPHPIGATADKLLRVRAFARMPSPSSMMH